MNHRRIGKELGVSILKEIFQKFQISRIHVLDKKLPRASKPAVHFDTDSSVVCWISSINLFSAYLNECSTKVNEQNKKYNSHEINTNDQTEKYEIA